MRAMNSEHAEKKWSESLRQQTRLAIEEMWLNPCSRSLHMKSINGLYGVISVKNLLKNKFQIDAADGKEEVYDTVDELLEGGWVVD